jgi:hypothetical protein
VLDADGWVRLYLPAAQTARLISNFDPTHRLRGSNADCVADVRARQ